MEEKTTTIPYDKTSPETTKLFTDHDFNRGGEEEHKRKKLYVCWTSWGFVHHDIDEVAFTSFDEAWKWLEDTMKVIEQCEGIRDAATRKYKESDPKKYEQMYEEAWSFERKRGLKPMTNNAGIRTVEVFEQYDKEKTRRKPMHYVIS